jgi:phospholipid N-methyltransferase
MTREILRRLGPEAHVHAVEIDASLLRATVQRTHDRRLRAHHGSAAHTKDLLDASCVGKVDAVVSSLGLAAMDRELRWRIQQSIQDVLAPGGLYTQYAYPHARAITVSFARREIYQFDAGAFLRRSWSEVYEEFVPANIPPAFVYTCRRGLAR